MARDLESGRNEFLRTEPSLGLDAALGLRHGHGHGHGHGGDMSGDQKETKKTCEVYFQRYNGLVEKEGGIGIIWGSSVCNELILFIC